MMLKGKTKLMALGAGLYWGSSMLLSSVWWAGSTVLDTPSFFDGFASMVTFGLICFLVAGRAWFKQERAQKALAFAGVLFFCLSVVVTAVVPPEYEASVWILLALQGCQTACFIAFWGLGFACLDKEEAEKTVVAAMLVAFALYGVGSLIPQAWGGVLLTGVLKSLGVLPFLLGRYKMPVVYREHLPRNYALLRPFYVSRFFFGLCAGVASCLMVFYSPDVPASSPILCVVLACTMIGVGAWCSLHLQRMTSLLRIAPLVMVGPLMFPYVLGESVAGVFFASSHLVIFLSWIVLSSIQLSDLKERVGWDEATLSFSEKAVYLGGSLVAYLATFSLCSLLEESTLSWFATHVQMIVLYAAVVVACFLMANLIERKDRARVLDKALRLSEKQMDVIYEEIAREYGLTGREGEVLAFLARGYSRPALCEKLVIAESTARSHSKHVYQKLGIHAREELYELVEARKRRFSSEKGDL